MDYISKRLTDYILNKGVIEEKDYDIYNYGFVCFLEVALSTLTSIIIALFLIHSVIWVSRRTKLTKHIER